jgi:hypothetical protein
MPLLDEKTLFIHIPKTGGTTFNKLYNVGKRKDSLFGMLEKNGGLYSLQHMTPSELIYLGVLTEEELLSKFVFCFVRNPWEKLVSEYQMRFENLDVCCVDEYCPFHYRFDTFLDRVAEIVEQHKHSTYVTSKAFGGQRHDNHFRPQIDFVFHKGKNVMNFVGRMENYEDDFRIVCGLAGLKNVEVQKFRATNHDHYSTYYDEKTKDLVRKIYKEDIAYFGYTFEEE